MVVVGKPPLRTIGLAIIWLQHILGMYLLKKLQCLLYGDDEVPYDGLDEQSN